MIILVDKRLKTAHASIDRTVIATVLKVGPETIKRILPYWEDADYILCEAEVTKSKRGNKNFGK